MSEFLNKVEARGEARGQTRVLTLISKLIAAGRSNEIELITDNPAYCNKLMVEFGI